LSRVAGKQIGFVGLGVMGGAMSMNLLQANGSVWVYNRTREKAKSLVEAGATFGELDELAAKCEVIFLCVSRSEDVDGCLKRMMGAKPGTLFVDHSTIEPRAAREFHGRLAENGHRFVDAPVTGGSLGAKAGKLTIFLGGSETDVEEAKATAAPYTKRAERVGEAGAGQTAKMANQIAVAGTLLSVCESLAFAQKAGLDLGLIRDLVGGGAGGSWAMEYYGPKILNKDWSPGFTITNQVKDLDYCHDAAAELGASIPATDLANELLKRVLAAGYGDRTTAALYEEYLGVE
jgi:3-hydroxyisobutyrate dehydrogenase